MTENNPQTFRKKPVEIQAMQFDGTNAQAVAAWTGAWEPGEPKWSTTCDFWEIDTLEGVMRADIGDWIIRGIRGEFYPCKPEIFAATYDEVKA